MLRPSVLPPLLASLAGSALATTVQVTPPAAPPGSNVTAVYSNFFGISFELSFINYYFGNDSSSIPQPMLNYLAALRARGAADRPVRLRLGGNSMDSSTYVPDQTEIIKFTDPNANVNDQPVSYGSVLFDIMKNASARVDTAQWLIGLSLRDPNNTNIPLAAGDANKYLGDDLDAYLLGNEPDLYTSHGNRPGMANYTVYDYVGDYWVAFNNLGKTPQGDVLDLDKIAGPTICCAWNLDGVLTSGWYDDFKTQLKYITLQHYPQDNCFGSYRYHLDYYMSHTQTVNLAKWQETGLQIIANTPEDQRKPVLMDEFNSASCGGIPESDMFGMALWSADYALQLAAVGYSGAYLHTRERGVSYNLFDPPDAPAGGPGAWDTHANWYAMLAVTEALQSTNGSRVVDLGLGNSLYDYSAVSAGYAVYDAATSDVRTLALLNYANASMQATDFALPASVFAGAADPGAVLVRYLAAPSATETTNITWGNQTYAGAGDGTLAAAAATPWADRTYACAGGCTVQVPGPGMAVVFVGGVSKTPAANSPANSTTSASGAGRTTTDSTASAAAASVVWAWWTASVAFALTLWLS